MIITKLVDMAKTVKKVVKKAVATAPEKARCGASVTRA